MDRQQKTPLWMGLVSLGVGAFIVLSSLGALPSDSLRAPGWVGALAGGVFVVGGAAIVIQALGGAPASSGELPASAPPWMRIAQYLAVLFVFGAFALIGSWIAFWPGQREFSMSVGGVAAPASAMIGRAAFGVGAVITWLGFAAVLFAGWKRLRRA